MDLTAEALQDLSRQRLGIPHLYPYQLQTIRDILAEPGPRLVILPTGAGKSLIFTLPAFVLEGLTVIVYPLLVLMDDQLRRFRKVGLDCVLLRGGQTRAQRQEVWDCLAARQARILITNPEMLIQRAVRDRLRGLELSHLVFDEAHCVAQWGATFRPAYLEAARLARELKVPRLTALTATADPQIEAVLATDLFEGRPYARVVRIPDRPNIRYEVRRGLSRRRLLREILEEVERPLIVFVSSRLSTAHVAEVVARALGDASQVRVYHAGLTRQEKTAIESWFFDSRDGVLVSTCAYGMGVDKSDVRTVVHWDPAESVVAYLQESGRAGRDGKPSRAILLVSPHSHFRHDQDRQLAFDDRVCRRNGLLSALGPYEVECQLCDRCAPSPPRTSPWQLPTKPSWLARLSQHHPLAAQLWGRPSPAALRYGLHLSPLWARLAEGDLEEVEEALEALKLALDQGKISDYIDQELGPRSSSTGSSVAGRKDVHPGPTSGPSTGRG